MTPQEIIAAARDCLGTPFRHQGRLLGEALDCAGVAVHVARSVGHEVIEVTGYGRTPANGQLQAVLDAQPCLRLVDSHPCGAKAQPGDLLLMRFASEPQHVAILAEGSIIHAYEDAGKCVEHRLSAVWAARIVRVYRFVGLTAGRPFGRGG